MRSPAPCWCLSSFFLISWLGYVLTAAQDFLQLWRAEAALQLWRADFSLAVAFLVAELRLCSVGASGVASSPALEHRLTNCGWSLFPDKLPPLNPVYTEVLNVHESFNTKPGTYVVNAS